MSAAATFLYPLIQTELIIIYSRVSNATVVIMSFVLMIVILELELEIVI